MVEDPGFISMCRTLDPRFKVPTRSTVRRQLGQLEGNVRQALAAIMEKVWPLHPALTTDHWTSNVNDAYASLTVHYIDEKWNLVCKSMGVVPFGRPHTAERVASTT